MGQTVPCPNKNKYTNAILLMWIQDVALAQENVFTLDLENVSNIHLTCANVSWLALAWLAGPPSTHVFLVRRLIVQQLDFCPIFHISQKIQISIKLGQLGGHVVATLSWLHGNSTVTCPRRMSGDRSLFTLSMLSFQSWTTKMGFLSNFADSLHSYIAIF